MFDFALTPAVTLPVIVVLTVALVASILIYERRLRDQATKYKIASVNIIKVLIVAAEKEMERRSNRAIEFTYDSLKNIGWAKLARGDVSFEDIIFGALPKLRRREPAFDLQELRDALSNKPRFTDRFDPDRVGGGSGLARGATPSVDDFIADMDPSKTVEDAAGLEGGTTAPRPYHTTTHEAAAAEPEFSDHARSPRAG